MEKIGDVFKSSEGPPLLFIRAAAKLSIFAQTFQQNMDVSKKRDFVCLSHFRKNKFYYYNCLAKIKKIEFHPYSTTKVYMITIFSSSFLSPL